MMASKFKSGPAFRRIELQISEPKTFQLYTIPVQIGCLDIENDKTGVKTLFMSEFEKLVDAMLR